jgi:hypothetical protein
MKMYIPTYITVSTSSLFKIRKYFTTNQNTFYIKQLFPENRWRSWLRHKPEDRGLDSRWCHQIFHWPNLSDPGVDSASNKYEYKEYFPGDKCDQCVGLTSCHLHVPTVIKSEILNLLETSGTYRPVSGIVLHFLHCYQSLAGLLSRLYKPDMTFRIPSTKRIRLDWMKCWT